MSGTLARYFFIRYAITIMWFLIGVVAIVLLVDFTETSSRMGDLPGYTLTGGLFLTLVRTPLILQQTVPFIALFAGMTVLISLNRRYELVVARAAGISAIQFMRPFILGALLLGLCTLFILNPLAAFGQRQAQFMESQWRASSNSGNVSKTVPWLRQSSNGDDVIIGATTIIENGGLLVDAVFIHFDTDGRIVMRQDAESASLEDGYWLLNNVQQTRPGEIPQSFPSLKVPTKLRKEYVQEKLASPETVAFYDLSSKISVAKSFGISTKALETQFHSLLSLPLLLVAMTMIAATVSLKFSRFAQSRSVILGGILSGFVLYVVNVLVKAFGSSGVVPPFIAAWIPVVVALALGATILLHQEDG